MSSVIDVFFVYLYPECKPATPVIQVDLFFFISSPEVKLHAGDSNGKGKGVGRDAADGEREKSQGVRR